MNCGCLRMVQKLWIMRFGLRETDASGLWPSGSNVKVSASIMKAFAPNRIKIHLQPRAETRALPMEGGSSGETPMMRKSRERILAVSFTGKKSRTMAMAATCAAQPPSAWTKAKRNEGIDTVRLRASDGSYDVEDESGVERTLSAETVEERAVEDLSDCRTDEITGQRERDDGGGRFENNSDGGARLEIHVDGKGIDDTEQS